MSKKLEDISKMIKMAYATSFNMKKKRKNKESRNNIMILTIGPSN